MPLALACASHSPLMRDGECADDVRAAVRRGFADLATQVRDFAPDLIIQFSPDHFNGFFYELMPAVCVGTRADSIGDWDTTAGRLDVPHDDALALIRHLIHADFDVAQSRHMRVDHGFVQIWESLFGTAAGLPIVPVFINCAAPPLPTFRRARQLGEAVGRFAVASGKRVLIAASGGLSHDPPVPSIVGAPPEVHARLVYPHQPTPDERATRQGRTLAAGRAAHEGQGDILPVSPEWDADFLARLRSDDTRTFDTVVTEELVPVAGRGGPEVLCWVAAMAAARAGGPVSTTLHFYEAIQGWVAGMAILSGTAEDAGPERAPA